MRDIDPTASEYISSGYLASSRPGGRLHDPVTATVAAVGSNLVGGMMSADAASSAADTQAAASDRATQLQKQMFDKQVELQEPFRQGGLAAQNKLLYLLGLDSGGTDLTYDQLYKELAPQYTTTSTSAASGSPAASIFQKFYGRLGSPMLGSSGSTTSTSINEAELQKAIQARLQQQQAAKDNVSKDPAFGSLMRDFGMSDFQADPGYQWRMDQGQKALERSAAARGGLLSGAATKAAMDYGQNQASAEYTNAFNRFQTNRANKLNPLQSLMGASQTAANNQGQAASNYGNSVGNIMTNMGNAQAASQIAQGNAWTNALNSGWNNYQNNQLMSKLFPSNSGGSNWGSLNNQYFTGTGGMGD